MDPIRLGKYALEKDPTIFYSIKIWKIYRIGSSVLTKFSNLLTHPTDHLLSLANLTVCVITTDKICCAHHLGHVKLC